MRTHPAVLAAALACAAVAGEAAQLLVNPGCAVFSYEGDKVVIYQAEAATRVEATVGGKKRVFVANSDGLWSVSSVGSVPWRETRWSPDDEWVAALLVVLDRQATGVRSEKGIATAYEPVASFKPKLERVDYRRDAKGVSGYTVGGVEVHRTEIGALPGLPPDAFATPNRQRSGLAKLADATKGLVASDQPKVSSTAGARGVSEEEKKLGNSYNFAAVEKVERTRVDEVEVDAFIRAGKLGGGS
jgi:hypothetical protein